MIGDILNQADDEVSKLWDFLMGKTVLRISRFLNLFRISIFGFRIYCAGYAIIFLTAFFLFPVQGAVAEPNAAVQFLIKSPVSMLDWGFKNIEDHLIRNQEALTANEKDLLNKTVSVSVDYDWSKDAIRISIGLRLSEKTQKTPMTMADIREQVVFIVKYLRGGLSMNPYDAFFRHKGFRHRGAPENLENKLSEITELIVTVRDKNSNIVSMCSAPLLGDAIEWLMIGKQQNN
jgi:hypothetical protein